MSTLIEILISYPSLLDFEREEAARDHHRGLQAVEREIFHLESICNEWGSWDDAYIFVQNRNRNFIKSNLYYPSFSSANMNVICFLDKDKKIVFSGGYDLINGSKMLPVFFQKSETIINSGLLNFRPSPNQGLQHISGMILTEFGIMAISIRPVLPSVNRGISKGYIIMGRLINAKVIQKLSDQTAVKFNIIIRDKSLNPEPAAVFDELSRTGEKNTMKYGKDNILLYSLYPDIYGQPSFLFYVDYPRNVRAEGIKIATVNLVFILLGFIILIFSMAMLLEYSVIIPVHILNKQIISIVTGDYSSDRKLKTLDELGLLSAAIDDMAMTIRKDAENMKVLNKELEMLSITDALTSVCNRRNFDETIRLEWERACRAREHISLVMCDIDYFKKYNDHYGHQAGDNILVKVAGTLTKCMKRMTDRVYRYGGEEFIIILPNTDTQGAVSIADKLLRAVRDMKITHSESEISDIVTISIGCASVVPPRGSNYSCIVSLTDKALYEAKHKGRNRICSARTSRDDTITFAEFTVEG